MKNTFARLKQYRAVATRYDKLKKNYQSMIALACGYLYEISTDSRGVSLKISNL